MVVLIELADDADTIRITFYLNNDIITAVDYDDIGIPNACAERVITNRVNPNIIHKDKYRAAFDNLGHMLPIMYPPGCQEKLVFDFDLRVYNGRILFPNRLTNVCHMIFRGNATPHLIQDWHDGMSHYFVPKITIHVRNGEVMRGLGQLRAIQRAKNLEILGPGFSDITNEEIETFACKECIIRSINLTEDGMRYMLRQLREERPGEDRWFVSIRALTNRPQEFFEGLVPVEDREAWNVENIAHNLGANILEG